MKNPFNQIATFQDYVDIIGMPKEQLQSEEAQNRINKWLVQATEQFDSMISGNGKLGRLYRWFNELKDNEEDNYKKYKLIKAICSWVETFVIKGKFWVDGLPVINSNVDIQINSSSNDSNVEMKRKDIIQDLVSIGLYQTTNFGDSNTYQDNQQNANQLIEELVVLSKNELNNDYLKVHPQKPLQGNLDFANNDLVNGGNIIGSTQQARNKIQYYNILDSTIDLSKNTIIGSIPVDPNQLQSINEEITKLKEEQKIQNIDIRANRDALTIREQIDDQQNTSLRDLNARIIRNINQLGVHKSLIEDNIRNIAVNSRNIQNNTNNIQTNTTNITALDGRLVSVSSLLNDTINGLKTLKPFQYVGEYQAGTTYRINQAVSLNNNLYLSKEDNNTTTPPGAKWLLLNEDFATIDLTQYYTKLEVNAIRNALQNSINTNTTNITTIRNNYLDKTSTSNNIIAGNSTYFTHSVYVNQPYNANLTPNYDFLVNGNSSLDNAIFNGNVEFTNSPTVPTPTADNHATNKGYVDTAIRNNTPSLSGVVQTTGNQTISGTKTFNSSIELGNNTYLTKTTNDTLLLATIINQGQKYVDILFQQPTNGFRNYCNINLKVKNGSNGTPTTVFSLQTRDTNAGVYATCEGDKFSFTNPTKVSNVATPTNDYDAANKGYVDSRAGATLPNWERVHSVSNFNPIDGATINYLFMNDYEYLIYIDTFNTVLKGQAQIHFFPNFKGTNDEVVDDDYITRMFLAHTGQNGKSWNTDFFTIGIFRRSQIRFLPNERNYNALNGVKMNIRIYRRRQ